MNNLFLTKWRRDHIHFSFRCIKQFKGRLNKIRICSKQLRKCKWIIITWLYILRCLNFLSHFFIRFSLILYNFLFISVYITAQYAVYILHFSLRSTFLESFRKLQCYMKGHLNWRDSQRHSVSACLILLFLWSADMKFYYIFTNAQYYSLICHKNMPC